MNFNGDPGTDPRQIINDANEANASYAPGIQYGSIFSPERLAENVGKSVGTPTPRSGISGDPAYQPHTLRTGTMERYTSPGITHGIHKPVDPTISGKNYSNVRVLPSVRGNDDVNFQSGLY